MFSLEPGAVLHSRYRIMREIGKGGMGAVYEAIDSRLRNTVAVKQMIAGRDDRAFEHEAQFLAALRHAGLPVVIDYFIEDDNHYLVMQYIEGEDLAHLLKRRHLSCRPDEVVAWGRSILDVLIYLHGHQPPIVHRDIKPANIKLTPRGEVVLLDFGLAKGRPQQETHTDDSISVFGYTPNYAPPEQVEWRGTDPRSDLFALGATLYHLVTGISPVTAQARAAALKGGHPDPLLPASMLKEDVPRPLSVVIARSMELEPARRFSAAREMREALAIEPGVAYGVRRPPETSGARRVDAAMPSQAQVGSPVDLIVQVRFADSPLLGLEDWPTRRRPPKIEQASEALHIEYPVDPRTGERTSARVMIKLVAPDFTVEGQTEHLIDVPPDEYSKRLALLLTARRPGFCRVNVEVYALDSLFLGAIPVEAEAVAVSVVNPVLRVANLDLALAIRRSPPPQSPDPRALREFEEAAATAAAVTGVLVTSPEDHAESPGATELSIPTQVTGPVGRRWLYTAAPMALVLVTGVVFYQSLSQDASIDSPPTPVAASPPPPSPLQLPPDVAPKSPPASPAAPETKPAGSPAPAAPPRISDTGPPPAAVESPLPAPAGPPPPATAPAAPVAVVPRAADPLPMDPAPRPSMAPTKPPESVGPSEYPLLARVLSTNAKVELILSTLQWVRPGHSQGQPGLRQSWGSDGDQHD